MKIDEALFARHSKKRYFQKVIKITYIHFLYPLRHRRRSQSSSPHQMAGTYIRNLLCTTRGWN